MGVKLMRNTTYMCAHVAQMLPNCASAPVLLCKYQYLHCTHQVRVLVLASYTPSSSTVSDVSIVQHR
jgi:hypothetical protein